MSHTMNLELLFQEDLFVSRRKNGKVFKVPSANVELGHRLQKLRKLRGLSQTELGEKLGLSQRGISHYESGYNRIPAPLLPQIAATLNVSFAELLGGSPVESIKASKRVMKLATDVERLPSRKKREVENFIHFIANS